MEEEIEEWIDDFFEEVGLTEPVLNFYLLLSGEKVGKDEHYFGLLALVGEDS